jgi:hypothetical protein
MAVWRDPLEELIEDLERTLPPAPPPNTGPTMAEYRKQLDAVQCTVNAMIRLERGKKLDPWMEQEVREAEEWLGAFWEKYWPAKS